MNNLFRTFAVSVAALTFSLTTPLFANLDTYTWTGGGADNNWTTVGNWTGPNPIPQSNDNLIFTGNTRTTNNNDYLPGLSVASVTFDANANAFSLTGNYIGFFNTTGPNTITNDSTNLQTLSFSGFGIYVNIPGGGPLVIDAAAGDLLLNTRITMQDASVRFEGAGTTTVTGQISDAPATSRGITKEGSGTLVLTGDNIYRGGTTIEDGTLVVGHPNALGIEEPNIFAVVHNDVVLNGGTLRTQEGIPRIFCAPDNYIQNSGTLLMQIGGLDPGTTSDQMQVGRSADLDAGVGTTTLFVHQINNFMPSPGARVTIITTNNGTTKDFGGRPPGVVIDEFDVVDSDFPGLIQPTADYFTDHVDVVFALSDTFANQGITRNQISVGEALDHAFLDDCAPALVDFVGNLGPDARLAAFDAIAPEEITSLYEIGFSFANVKNANLLRRMDDIRQSVNGFCDHGTAVVETAAGGKGPEGKSVVDAKTVQSEKTVMTDLCAERQWGFFVNGEGQFADIKNKDPNARSYEITNAAVIAGFDYRFNNHFAVGIDGGYDRGDSHFANGSNIRVDSARAGIYATFFTGGFHVEGAANGALNDYKTLRVGLLGNERGNTEGGEFDGIISGGYDWKAGCYSFGPVASFQYTYIEFDGFDESDTSVAPLHFPDQNQDSARSSVGFKITHESPMGSALLRPELRLAWQHEFADTAHWIDSQFFDCPDVFRVWGPNLGRDSLLVNAGFSILWGRCHNIATYVYYDGNILRENYDSNSVSGGVRLSF